MEKEGQSENDGRREVSNGRLMAPASFKTLKDRVVHWYMHCIIAVLSYAVVWISQKHLEPQLNDFHHSFQN